MAMFPLYIITQIILWFVSGGNWAWLMKSTEIFMIISSADSYFAADLIGVFDACLADLIRGLIYPSGARAKLVRIRIIQTQDKIIRTAALAIISFVIDQFFV